MATIKVPEETLVQVKTIAEHTGRSSHWVMLEAINQYVADTQKAIEIVGILRVKHQREERY